MDLEEIKAGILRGNRRAVAKAISMIEEGNKEIYEVIKDLKEYSGRAIVVGITGPPGVGKSSLISKLIKEALGKGMKVGVLLVDPSSPISGGALLGNRLRMMETVTNENVYIRSLATRGWKGGLSKAVDDSITILEASGKDIIFIETVGAGQIETDIAKKADIVVVVLMPYSGDEIQALKAGLMEIGDIFVINKEDLDKARSTELVLRMILEKDKGSRIIYTSALYNRGIKELFELIINVWNDFNKNGEIDKRRIERIRSKLLNYLTFQLDSAMNKFLTEEANTIDNITSKVINKEISEIDAAEILLKKLYEKILTNQFKE
ncbi:MAG: methylmalonyl Co-A mutase-associated GTPase MeaB [Thermoproteota archaeon]|jgi:LAO/AO transport system ATPase